MFAFTVELPLIVVHEDAVLLEKAAEIKATHRLSVADAWIAATAVLLNATLVHKDPKFEPLPIPQHRLPYNASRPAASPSSCHTR